MTLKLAINGLSGNLQNPNNFCYSPMAVMKIRINGQLLLLMLAEKLIEAGGKIIQANTDGLFCIFKKKDEEIYNKIMKEWEGQTGLELEEDRFESMFQYAINDYIAVKEGYSKSKDPGLIKTKGMFLTSIGLGKGMQPLIIPNAIIKYLVDRVPYEDTIRNCKDITQFITYQKVSREYSCEYNGEIITHINRFYYSNEAPYLYKCKVVGNKRTNYIKLNSKTGCRIVNDLSLVKEFPNDINYLYYISEVRKIISDFENIQLNLF